MKSLYRVALAVALGFSCSHKPSVEEEFFTTTVKTYKIAPSQVVDFLCDHATRDEYQVLYLYEDSTLVNLTVQSTYKSARIDKAVLDSLIDLKKRFLLVHNHNTRNLDSLHLQKNALYWFGPSPDDLSQYCAVNFKGADFDYGIVTTQGLLLLQTDTSTCTQIAQIPFNNILYQEAGFIQQSLSNVSPDSVKSWAESHKGIFGFKFIPRSE